MAMDHLNLVSAIKIYNILLNNGKLDFNEEQLLYSEYEDETVKLIVNTIAVQSKAYLFESRKVLYLVPEVDNDMITYSNEELKRSILWNPKANMSDLYTCYYIAITIFSLMYSAKGYFRKIGSERLLLSKIEETVTNSLKQFLSYENLTEIENENEFNIKNVARVWEMLKEYKDDKDIYKQNSRKGYVIRTCMFLKNHGLVRIINMDTQIETTDKLDKIIQNYYAHPDREAKIMELLMNVQEKENGNPNISKTPDMED